MLMAYRKNQKGQDLVEYALMLAIIVGIGWGIYSQTGVADSIKNVFGNASSLMETAKKNTGTFDIDAVLKHFDEMQKGYLGNGYNIDYKRGLFSSVWLNKEDAADDKVKSLASELELRCGRITTGRRAASKAASCTGPQKKILTQNH